MGEVPREIPQETPETQEPSLLERFEEAVGLKKPEDAAEPAQREADKANRSLEQPSVASNIRQGQTQPSRAVYAHPGSFQKGNQIQEPQVSGFARHMAHAHDAPVQSAQPAPAVALTSSHSSSVLMASQAHAPVHNAQAAPTASLPSSPISSVPAASQAHAPVQYAHPLPVAAQAPVKQTSTAQNIPPNFVPTVIAQPPGARQLSRAAQVAPHVTGQTAPLVGQTAYAARAVQSRQ